MKKFQFRLEALLKFRRMQKEQAEMKLAEASIKLGEEKAKLAEAENLLANNRNLLRQTKNNKVPINVLSSFQQYLDKIKDGLIIQAETVQKAEELRHQRLMELRHSVKSCEIVEQLKAKRFEQYQVEILVEEQKFLDELGLQNYVRKN